MGYLFLFAFECHLSTILMILLTKSSFAKQVVFKQWLIFLVGSSGSSKMRGGLVLSFTLLNDRRNRKSNYSMLEEHVGSREYVTPHLCRNQD